MTFFASECRTSEGWLIIKKIKSMNHSHNGYEKENLMFSELTSSTETGGKYGKGNN